jgi:hypothetical protein
VVIAASLPMFLLALVPAERTTCLSESAGGGLVCTTRDVSLVEDEGYHMVLVLLVPVLLSGLALLAGRRAVAIGVAVLLTLATLVAVASIGLLYLPTVLLAWWAVAAPRERRVARASHGGHVLGSPS